MSGIDTRSMIDKVNHTHCCYCRRRFSEIIKHLTRTMDHFFPTSRLGHNKRVNKLQCCHECNQWKADKLPSIWLHEVQVSFDKRKVKGHYQLRDYAQIIGSLKHWIATLKDEIIGEYKL